MKRVGVVFLGIVCGILLYFLYATFFVKKEMLSPFDEAPYSQVIKQNTK